MMQYLGEVGFQCWKTWLRLWVIFLKTLYLRALSKMQTLIECAVAPGLAGLAVILVMMMPTQGSHVAGCLG